MDRIKKSADRTCQEHPILSRVEHSSAAEVGGPSPGNLSFSYSSGCMQ